MATITIIVIHGKFVFQSYRKLNSTGIQNYKVSPIETIHDNGFFVKPCTKFIPSNFTDKLSILTGVVLGSFYYGYVALQIPGGWLALRVGGTRLFGGAVLVASILTLLTPVATRQSVTLLIAVRICEGLVLVSIFYNNNHNNNNNNNNDDDVDDDDTNNKLKCQCSAFNQTIAVQQELQPITISCYRKNCD